MEKKVSKMADTCNLNDCCHTENIPGENWHSLGNCFGHVGF